MHIVGRIDRNIYQCITNDIITDEVVITDNQLQHILERHPDSYYRVVDQLEIAISDPDYIKKISISTPDWLSDRLICVRKVCR